MNHPRLSKNITLQIVKWMILPFIAFTLPTSLTAQTTIVVNTLDDDGNTSDGDCDLREAITAANTNVAVDACPAGSIADTIDLTGLTGAILLSGSEIAITEDLTVNGPGADQLSVDAGLLSRIFNISASVVSLNHLTLTRGLAPLQTNGMCGMGGAIFSQATSLSMTGVVVSQSTINSNCLGGEAGGIFQASGLLSLKQSSVHGNSSNIFGRAGGIRNPNGVVQLENSTVSDNTGGNGALGGADLQISNSTIINNTGLDCGGGISGSQITLYSSIIADNQDIGGNCDCHNILGLTSVVSRGYNLLGDISNGFCGGPYVAGVADQVDVLVTNLGPLANNGGPTPTHLVLPSSPARDAGDCSQPGSPTTDQRGMPRPIDLPPIANAGDGCDTGAVEATEPEALPVELTHFEALVDEDIVQLSWQTASETNNAGFEVQRMYAEADWRPIAFVEGFGTTTEAQHYSYRVKGLPAGQYRFRLKQIDFDGTFAYSAEVKVEISVSGSYALTSVYPNPFTTHARIRLSVSRTQRVEVEVFDGLGRLVSRVFDGVIEAGVAKEVGLDGAGLPVGMYQLRVAGENFSVTRSVVMVR